ncbi:DUF5590 domain-containing protein [Paenibacillus protaetiae]|uniref:Cell wall elongation regulator TseB-like domain-containing protein n=1 Tax=Paenibacillus protaetiae TaxID=2509456 RepID=A0A4P6ET50_9BACL|nr:DUF5590 domain-containing protein [Paenibacillus protaetiae]QAY66124.1 hypothetical protein ET464_06680 [Paenibacillus protaetiae]
MSVQRIIMMVAIVIIALVTAALLYYQSIQKPLWNHESDIAAKARDEAQLVKIDEIYKYVWDSPMWVVKGKTDAGDEQYVWMDQDGNVVLTLQAAEQISKDSVVQLFMQSHSGASIIRMQPAYVNNTPAWEIYFSQDGKYSYSFYSFHDGSFMDEYHLTGKTAS